MTPFLEQAYTGLKPGMKVLDLGAGDLAHAASMRERGAAEVIAVDKKKPKQVPDGIIFQEQSVEDYMAKLPDTDTFDFVLARNIFQFMDKNLVLNTLLKKLVEHIRPSGIIAIETFNKPPEPNFEKPNKSFYSLSELIEALPFEPLLAEEVAEKAKDKAGISRTFYLTRYIVKKP